VILKAAKQERTINPDTRLHSDEMRERDEEERPACKKPKGREHHWERRKGHVWGTGPSINDVRL